MGAYFEYETPDIAVYINYFANVVVVVAMGISTMAGMGKVMTTDLMFFLFPYLGMLVLSSWWGRAQALSGGVLGSQWGRTWLSVGACFVLSLLQLQQYRAVLTH